MTTISEWPTGDAWQPWFYEAIRPLREDESILSKFLDTRVMQVSVKWFLEMQLLDALSPLAFPMQGVDSDMLERQVDLRQQIQRLSWPPTYKQRLLGMVIRQWVETEPDATSDVTLARQLDRSDDWHRFIRYLQQSGYAQVAQTDDGASVLHTLALHLRNAGLPYNPATVQHLRAVLRGEQLPLPTRGVLVTTLGYVSAPYETRTGSSPDDHFFCPPHETIIEGITEWMPDSLFKRVNALVRQHEAFLDHDNPYLLTTRSMVRTLQPGAFQAKERATIADLDCDYESVAIRCAHEIKREEVANLGLDQAVTHYLGVIYHRVYERRKKAELSTAAPPGWRVRARALIKTELEKSRV